MSFLIVGFALRAVWHLEILVRIKRRRWHPKLAASWLKPLECGLSDPRGMEELILNRICITKSYRKQWLQSLSAGGGPVVLRNAQSNTSSAWKHALPPVTPALRRSATVVETDSASCTCCWQIWQSSAPALSADWEKWWLSNELADFFFN